MLWIDTFSKTALIYWKFKMGVISAHFRQEGKFPDWIDSFNAEWMKSVKNFAFSFIILVGTSPFWEVLLQSKDLIFFKTSPRFIVSKLKVLFSWQIFFIAMILGWFLYFSNIKVIGSSPTNGSIPLAKLVSW